MVVDLRSPVLPLLPRAVGRAGAGAAGRVPLHAVPAPPVVSVTRPALPPDARAALLQHLHVFGVDLKEVQEAIDNHPQHVVAQKRFGPLLPLAFAVLAVADPDEVQP